LYDCFFVSPDTSQNPPPKKRSADHRDGASYALAPTAVNCRQTQRPVDLGLFLALENELRLLEAGIRRTNQNLEKFEMHLSR